MAGAPTPESRRVTFSRQFVGFLVVAFAVTAIARPYPHIAMWVGFLFAAYSAIANDSIQTLGTFIASNRGRPWWQLWLFSGVVFSATIIYSWIHYGGDVSYERLASKGFEESPTEFHFLQLAAPLVLIILTRLRMPVSTTFLLLSAFAASGKSVGAVTLKSLTGYGIAFVCAIALWGILGPAMHRRFRGTAHPGWRVMQWFTTGALWSVWLQQDAANIAVFLPRSLSLGELLVFVTVIFVGLGALFHQGGERIQEVVDEKSHIVDVRAATIVDFLYACILWLFKLQSKVPMSTTWVFVGLLAGREIGMSLRNVGEGGRSLQDALRLAGKDLAYVTIGFGISLVVAAAANPAVRKGLLGG